MPQLSCMGSHVLVPDYVYDDVEAVVSSSV